MTIGEFSKVLQKLDGTASRNEITVILAELLFAKLKADEIDKAVYLSLGILAPSFKNIIFNLADKMVIRAIAQAYEKTPEEVLKNYKITGDLGKTAEFFAESIKLNANNFSINEIYEKLFLIAAEGGEGSQERRIQKLAELLKNLDPLSAKYVTRIPIGKLRLGFSDLTIIDALSWYEKGDKSGKSKVVAAYQVISDIGLIAKKIKEQGIDKACRQVKPILGTPVMPMLAQPLKSPTDMIAKMGEVFVEPKFDGVRILVHFRKGKFVRAFTRNLNEVSHMFPELAKLSENSSSDELILDCEALGLDESTMRNVDFQTTMRRRRKHEIDTVAGQIPLRFFVFDILYKDGGNLMPLAYEVRREILAETFSKPYKLFQIVEFLKTSDPEKIMQFYKEKISEGLEGIIAKKADSPYVPGRTGWRWVKMKEEEAQAGKLADTVDAVIMGFTRGQGKRTSFGVGQFLAGIVDGEKILSVTKVGTGLTDEQFKELKTRLEKIDVKEKPENYEVPKTLIPDIWVKPEIVVELAADEITKSPIHMAGYALRFPRLVKFRDDKNFNQATDLKYLKKLFELQKKS